MKTVSLETAKQLKEVGFPQETVFSYYRNNDGVIINPEVYTRYEGVEALNRVCASPTADEILDELPYLIKKDNQWYSLTLEFDEDKSQEYKGVTAGYRDHSGKWIMGSGTDDLLRSLSDVWLYLKKEGLI